MVSGRNATWHLPALLLSMACVAATVVWFAGEASPEAAPLDRRGGFLQQYRQMQRPPNAAPAIPIGQQPHIELDRELISVLLRDRLRPSGPPTAQSKHEFRFNACFHSETVRDGMRSMGPTLMLPSSPAHPLPCPHEVS